MWLSPYENTGALGPLKCVLIEVAGTADMHNAQLSGGVASLVLLMLKLMNPAEVRAITIIMV